MALIKDIDKTKLVRTRGYGGNVTVPVDADQYNDLTMVETSPEPYRNRACSDYLASSGAELRVIFGRDANRLHKGEHGLTLLAQMILRKLGHVDISETHIPIRDLHNFHVEIVGILAKNLAEYMLVPQRYNDEPRNVIAGALTMFMRRIRRFRGGHNLDYMPLYPLTKRKYGYLIDKIMDNGFLWDYAQRWVKRYEWRVKHGYVEPL